MAGRILTTLRKVEEVEKAAAELSWQVYAMVPQQYMTRPDGRDPICVAWVTAVEKVMVAGVAMQQLGDALREKAKVRRPGPAAVFLGDAPEPAPEPAE